jgi:hypothetical protein
VLAQEVEHRGIEPIGLFPIRGVAGFRDHERGRARDPCGEETENGWRRVEIPVTGEQKRRHGQRSERGKGDAVLNRLRRCHGARGPARALEREPAGHALRVRRAIRRAELAEVRRQRLELRRRPQAASHLEVVGILNAADAVGHDERPQS